MLAVLFLLFVAALTTPRVSARPTTTLSRMVIDTPPPALRESTQFTTSKSHAWETISLLDNTPEATPFPSSSVDVSGDTDPYPVSSSASAEETSRGSAAPAPDFALARTGTPSAVVGSVGGYVENAEKVHSDSVLSGLISIHNLS